MRRIASGRAGAALVLALVAVGCDAERTTPFYAEDFEMLCDGTPCGWERSVGAPDQATWVETVHVGEHALRLTGNVTVRGPGGDTTSTTSTLCARIAVRCDRNSFLVADIVINDAAGSRTFTEEPVQTRPEWILSSFPLGDGTGLRNSRVVAVVFTKSGSGSCEIADIVIEDQILLGGC